LRIFSVLQLDSLEREKQDKPAQLSDARLSSPSGRYRCGSRLAKAAGLQAVFIDNSMIHFLAVLTGSLAVSLPLSILLKKRTKGDALQRPADRAWTEINLDNLRHNVQVLRGELSDPCEIMAVVKADAYGHGSAEISMYLNRLGVRAFAVATIDEGIHLRRKGVQGEILVLGYTSPSRALELRRFRLSQAVADAEHAKELDRCGMSLQIHLKINTGMNRLGEDFSQVPEIISVFQCKNVIVRGIFTHLCVSDSCKPVDSAFTNRQIQHFYILLEELKDKGIQLPKIHIQSSYGVFNYPELRCDYARIGIALYGVLSRPNEQIKLPLNLKPVLSLKSRVSLVRKIGPDESVGYGREFITRENSKIAVVSIGYADGVPRSLSSGKSSVLIRGCRAPIAGRICMDQLMADVTGLQNVERGDIVTLIGEDGSEEILAEQMAEDAGTITNELLSRLSTRLHRIFTARSQTEGFLGLWKVL
jgi:serine/alanine racemase